MYPRIVLGRSYPRIQRNAWHSQDVQSGEQEGAASKRVLQGKPWGLTTPSSTYQRIIAWRSGAREDHAREKLADEASEGSAGHDARHKKARGQREAVREEAKEEGVDAEEGTDLRRDRLAGVEKVLDAVLMRGEQQTHER